MLSICKIQPEMVHSVHVLYTIVRLFLTVWLTLIFIFKMFTIKNVTRMITSNGKQTESHESSIYRKYFFLIMLTWLLMCRYYLFVNFVWSSDLCSFLFMLPFLKILLVSFIIFLCKCILKIAERIYFLKEYGHKQGWQHP